MRRQTYRLYGLTIASEIPLHQDRLRDGAVPDVVMTLGERCPVPALPPPGIVLADVSEDDQFARYFSFVRCPVDGYVLRYYGIADFVVSSDLSRVVVHLDPAADGGFASVLATGSLPAFLLLAMGMPLLHASAVDVADDTLAFVGHAGIGKSTMATVMCAAGATLVTDDVLRVQIGADAVRCYLGATETRLRKSASDLADAFEAPLVTRRTSDDRDALQLPGACKELLRLAAIVVPQPNRDSDVVKMDRLGRAQALLTLSRFPRIVGWRHTTVLAQQFGFLADIVERVPVFIGQIPWGPPFASDLADRVMAGIGLPRIRRAPKHGRRD